MAWQRRNRNRQGATTMRRQLRQEPHWEGQGYTYGRSGLYIDAALLTDLREAVQGSLATHVTWAELANEPFDEAKARQYQQGLKDALRAIADANEVLKGPFWPRADRTSRPTGGEPNQ
ncbi:hypothetical protein [Blastococcus sp. TF02A-30]|uniref:hypothetical protein n=1 Tax=Blastococcus sp. TF02A-30 TaxID=2250580 RepID=UPI000DEA863D|nr:hypothetical protein [Blastococcus sp. TF02A-30]RBY92680.1 hypothetical protein DQ241_00960 [Blastococcus sp. TF02A-30]